MKTLVILLILISCNIAYALESVGCPTQKTSHIIGKELKNCNISATGLTLTNVVLINSHINTTSLTLENTTIKESTIISMGIKSDGSNIENSKIQASGILKGANNKVTSTTISCNWTRDATFKSDNCRYESSDVKGSYPDIPDSED